MGKPAATLGSYHVCPKVNPGPTPHVGGPVAMGSADVLIGGIPAAREGDRLICVGPPDTISSCSSNVLINGKKAACLGDGTAHGGKIVVGNMTVYFGSESGGFSVLSPTTLGSFNPAMHSAPPNHEMRCGNATYKTDGNGDIASAGGDTAALQSDPSPHPYLEPGRIYGGNTLPCGGRDSTNCLVFKDPATEHLDNDRWRNPVVKDGVVQPFEGTDGGPKAIPMADEAGQTVERTFKGKKYIVKKNEHGFPEFTIFETYLDSSHVNSKDATAHFRAANERLRDLLNDQPHLAQHLGLDEDQMDFIKHSPNLEESPPGLTWHHHEVTGKMQLVDRELHRRFNHVGGMKIWGGSR